MVDLILILRGTETGKWKIETQKWKIEIRKPNLGNRARLLKLTAQGMPRRFPISDWHLPPHPLPLGCLEHHIRSDGW